LALTFDRFDAVRCQGQLFTSINQPTRNGLTRFRVA